MLKPPPHVTGNCIDITGLGHIGVCSHDPEICEKPMSLISAIDFKNKTVTYIDLEGEPPTQKVKEETKHGSIHFFIDKDLVLQLKTLDEQTEECRKILSMDTPFVVETQSGTTFIVEPQGLTEMLRTDQPACKVPTSDLLEFVKKHDEHTHKDIS